MLVEYKIAENWLSNHKIISDTVQIFKDKGVHTTHTHTFIWEEDETEGKSVRTSIRRYFFYRLPHYKYTLFSA